MLNSCEGSHKCDSTAFKLAGVSTNFCLHGLACGGVSDQSFYLSMWACLQWVVLAVWSVSSYIVLSRCSQLWNCGGGGGLRWHLAAYLQLYLERAWVRLCLSQTWAQRCLFFFFFAMEGNWWSGGNSVTLFMLLKDGESSDEASPQKYVIFLFLMLFIIR